MSILALCVLCRLLCLFVLVIGNLARVVELLHDREVKCLGGFLHFLFSLGFFVLARLFLGFLCVASCLVGSLKLGKLLMYIVKLFKRIRYFFCKLLGRRALGLTKSYICKSAKALVFKVAL